MKKSALMLKLVEDIRASYWFIPGLLVVVALVLAHMSRWLDHNPDILPFQLPDILINRQVDGVRTTLSTIATSIIGIAGAMFSITILAVSFAAGNYGPRLIGNFMRDRGNQVSLGILIATFVYALSILRAVQDPSEVGAGDAFVPEYSMLIAMVGAVLAVFTTIYFVHHVPETINVSNITAGVGTKLETALIEMIDAEAQMEDDNKAPPPDRDPDHVVRLDVSGYIQTVNYTQIEKFRADGNWIIDIVKKPGDFVTPYSEVLNIWGAEGNEDGDISGFSDCLAVGTSRIEVQNVFFLVDELVEILARALSPGVNDPFTAINCLNWMYNSIEIAKHHGDGLGEEGARKHKLAPRLKVEALFERSFLASKPYCEPDKLANDHYRLLLARMEGDTRS